MPSTYSTDTLIGVVQGLKTPSPSLLARYFPTISQDESEEIHFDLISGKRRIAPFVSPVVEGKIVESLGHTTKTFRPAYIKDKRVFDPNQPFKRSAGEQIGGSLSPLQRRDAHLAVQMQDQTDMITRRLEVMASETIRTGKVTVTGDGYPTQVVDFGRAAALTPAALAGTAKWNDAASKPRSNLRAWAKLVRQASGTNPIDVIMGEDAAEAFMDHASVREVLDNRNIVGATLQPGTELVEGLTFHGTVDRRNIFSYSGWYVDPATGTETEIWPADIVAMTSALLEGVRAFGAIRDGAAGFRAMPYFPKMWQVEDPAVEFLMMQSAPLVVPTRVDASLAVDVL